MRFRLRTAWLEIGAGFHLLFAAVAVHALEGRIGFFGPNGSQRDFGATLMFLAACAAFLLHPAQASRRIRKCLFFFAGAAALTGAVWLLMAGRFGIAALQIGYAAWLLGAVFFPWCDQRITAIDETPAVGFNLVCGAVLAAVGLHGLQGGASVSWHAPLAAAGSIAAGASLVWIEVRGAARSRRAAAVLGAIAFLYHGFAAFADVGAAGAMFAAASLLLLSAASRAGLPEAADDLSGLTPRQREIYVYERAGETTLWTIAALSSVFINFIAPVDARLYFFAILSIAIVTQHTYRLRPAAAISERRYLMTLAAIVASSILLIAATGGAAGPFVYLAYLAIFAGAFIVSPAWSIAVAGIYAAYVGAELVLHVYVEKHGGWSDGHVPRFLFLAVALLCTGLYTAWAGRRRVRMDEALLAANRRLAEALHDAVGERERYERQAQDLKGLNVNLIEMRSALMNVLEDVEESKRQIEADRRREVASFNALAEGVVAAGKDGKIFLCNPTAARILGMPVEAVIGQPIERVLRLFQEDSAVMQTGAFEGAYAGRIVSLGDRLRLTRADGSDVPVSGNVAPYLDEENRTTGIVAAFRDATVEREIDRQKSDFISIASHQLRTPLSALRWFLDLLLAGDAGPLKPTQKEYLGDMSVSIVRMIKLVGDLLDISRIESGRTKPNPEHVDARAFVESLVREFMPLVRQRGVAFTSTVAKDVGTFYADPSMARQAISNIIGNAVKYTPAGGSVALDVRAAGNETIFTVKDTGLGIPKSQHYRVYDKFFRGENAISQETVGSGLGLYMVKSISDLSGGRVWFESAENKGTTFHLTFPNGPKALPGTATSL